MTAAAATARRELHLRRIVCTGFERDDGRWDIEGRLTDTRPVPLPLPEKTVAPGAAIHDMLVCLTIDRDFTIHDAWARTLAGPYRTCAEINQRYTQLIGLRIEPGFTGKVKRLFRGVLGCSHLTELLPPMATTAFQVRWSYPSVGRDVAGSTTPLGGCHALRLDGEVVQRYFRQGFGAGAPVEDER